jgi:hypothetical protein
LSDIPSIPPETLRRLRSVWLQTAEEVLAAAATPEGVAGLQTLLNLDAPRLDGLLQDLGRVVGAEAAKAIRQRVTAGGSLGALLTEEQKQRLGMGGARRTRDGRP